MIKLADASLKSFKDVFPDESRDPFLCRVSSLYAVYGTAEPFADFWLGFDEDGRPVSAISRLDSQFTLYLTDKSDLAETAEFIYAVGASAVLCGSDFAIPLKFPVEESGSVLAFFDSSAPKGDKISVEVPRLKSVFELLQGNEDYQLSDFESFYLDLSHKILKDRARIYAVMRDNMVVSCAMTVAETENAAVIGAVATARKYRRRGFAGALVRKLCAELNSEGKTAYVYTQPKNEAFYKNLGFTNCGGWREFRLK